MEYIISTSIELAIVATIVCIILAVIFKKTVVRAVLIPYVLTTVGIILVSHIAGYRHNSSDSLFIDPIIIALGVIFVVVLFRRVVRPLRKTAEVIGALHEGKGDLTIRLDYD
ncbi:MAG: hypothetical protein LBG05_06660, partial [Treponema sp.]|nr:hypothetical protein [Treponema sp.]